jgi:hypothetical protein
MNRDTWRDESVSEILKVYFVFWQRGVTSPGGLHFIKLYNICNETDLDKQEGIAIFPGIYIIDPRTGALMKSLSVRVSDFTFSVKLLHDSSLNLSFLFRGVDLYHRAISPRR